MRRIEYTAPTTVAEAVQVLAGGSGRARMLAGGTDLIVQVREDLRPDWDLFVDAKKVPELSAMAFDQAGALSLGAAVPCYRIYGEPGAQAYPALIDAARIIGGIGIQGRASVGGNLCNAGPAGDSIPALIAHSATCVIAGPEHTRTVPVEHFCTAPGRNVLYDSELLVRLDFPAPQPHSGAAYLRFIPREEMDIAVVGAGVYVELDGLDGQVISRARVAIGAVAPTPLFVEEAGEALVGSIAGPQAYERAAEIARAASRPITDMRGTAEHRRHLVGVLVRRALEKAVARATGDLS